MTVDSSISAAVPPQRLTLHLGTFQALVFLLLLLNQLSAQHDLHRPFLYKI